MRERRMQRYNESGARAMEYFVTTLRPEKH